MLVRKEKLNYMDANHLKRCTHPARHWVRGSPSRSRELGARTATEPARRPSRSRNLGSTGAGGFQQTWGGGGGGSGGGVVIALTADKRLPTSWPPRSAMTG